MISAFSGLYAKASSTEQVRESEASGFDPDLWRLLVDTGAVAMAVPEARGGWGASVMDLALVAEQHGRFLGSAPLIEAQVAARWLARVHGDAAATTLAEVLDAKLLVTAAPRPAAGGRATLVPAGAIADVAIITVDDRMLGVRLAEHRTPVANTGSLPLADVDIAADTPEMAVGETVAGARAAAQDDWMVLYAAALVGLGQRALEIGAEYAKERYAFGVPIASFQAVAHRLADAHTALEGARLLAWEAAWAADAQPERAGELAAMAYAFATEAARQAAYWSLHFHGGYGFMDEYDIQLYHRRAWAWPAVLGSPQSTYRLLADRRYGEGQA